MKLLITGGAGYIGSVLVPMLLYEGHRVTVLDNFMYGQTSLLDCCQYPNLHIVRGSVTDSKTLKRSLEDVDAVLPLACLTGAPICDQRPDEAQAVNLYAIERMLAWRKPEQKIIFPTTNSGYGIGEKNAVSTEETPLRPISLYGILKVEAERAVLASGNAITLRLATAFGMSPRMRTDLLVNDFVLRAVTDGFIVLYEGQFRRNFIHVRDIARAFIHCLKNFETMKNNAYNVGLSSANMSKRELCREIQKFVPSCAVVEASAQSDPDRRDYVVSNEKIEKTGFCALYSLYDGIQELIRGYQIIRARRFSNV